MKRERKPRKNPLLFVAVAETHDGELVWRTNSETRSGAWGSAPVNRCQSCRNTFVDVHANNVCSYCVAQHNLKHHDERPEWYLDVRLWSNLCSHYKQLEKRKRKRELDSQVHLEWEPELFERSENG